MQTARDFLSILERDYHLDFSGSRGSSVETLLRQFVAANRVEARDQGQALMATANANLLKEYTAEKARHEESVKAYHAYAEEAVKTLADRQTEYLQHIAESGKTIDALKSEIAAIHSVAAAPQEPIEAPKEEN